MDKMRDVSRNISAVIDLSVVWRELMRNFLENEWEHKVLTHTHIHTVSANTKVDRCSDVRKRTVITTTAIRVTQYNVIRNMLVTTTN